MPRLSCIAVIFIGLPTLAGTASAAPADFAGKPVVAIEFHPEQQPYSREYLLQILPVKLSQPLKLADVRAAIERLYATGRYADVDVDARPAEGGVALRFLTQNNYFVGHITVQHVAEPPSGTVMANSSRLQLGTLFTDQEGRQAVTNIKQVLQNNGFFESSIEPEYEYDPQTQQVNIHFIIKSGKRARYRMPDVAGHPERPVKDIVKATHWKGWFGWKPDTEVRTQDGLQRVRRSYQKQQRLQARVRMDKMEHDVDTNRVTPTLNVEAGPRVRIEVVGAKVSQGKLRQLVPVYEEQSVDRDLLVEGANNLKEYFVGQGFFHADVQFTNQAADSSAALIQYKVALGQRHKVVLVSISGNKYFDTDTIRERMYVRPASFPQLRYGRYSENFLSRDRDSVAGLYRSNGFRDVNVIARTVHGYKGKETNIAVYIEIQEGQQWLVNSLDLAGVSEGNKAAVSGLLESIAGQPFSDLNVAFDRDNVLDYYYNNGYSNANFQWSFTPAKAPHSVDLKYVVQEGERRFVRDVLISGLQATDPRLVKERVSVQKGLPLSRARALETQRRLYDLGIFARVDMALQNPTGEEQDKYVLLDLEEARKYSVTGGFGAEIAKIGTGCQTCLESPAGQAGFSPRAYFGVTRRNFLGDGHIISFQSRASTLEQRGVLTYQAPQFRGSSNVNLLFSVLYDSSRDVNTFSAKREEGSVQVGQRLSRASTLLYRFSYRRVTVDRGTLKISPELIPLFSQPARIGMVAGNWINDRRDDPTDAHRGIYSTVDLSWASRAFGSQSEFTKTLVHNATYYPIGLGARYVLARSLTFGFLRTLGNNQDIPLPERFFGGGAQSHRGFPENQAGPRDPETGFPIGGKAILVNQVELRFPLLGDNLRGVLFEDAGNVYDSLSKMSLRVSQHGITDFNYMVHALGFGVRYRTPVGPVRLDLGWSINPPRFFGFKGTLAQLLQQTGTCIGPNGVTKPQCTVQQIGHFQFHFSLGQAF